MLENIWLNIDIICFVIGFILWFIAYKWVNNESGLPLIFFGFVFVICAAISETLRLAIMYGF